MMLLLQLLISSFSEAQIIKQKMPDNLVVLTFDDGAKSHYTYVAPMLKKYGFGATFFVCEFPPDYQDTNKYMSWSQIAAIHKLGFDIGNHTWHHKHVDKVSADTLNREVSYIRDQCLKFGIPAPKSFAYPGYDTYAPAIKILHSNGMINARTGGNKLYDPLKDNPFYIPSYSITGNDTTTIFAVIKSPHPGKILVLTIHGVPDIAHPWVNTPPEIFERYLKLLQANNCKVVSMKALASYINFEKASAVLELPTEFRNKK